MDIFLYIFSGINVKEFFSHEIGIHKFQRIPPTETKGRVHTSLITVAVVSRLETKKISLNIKDLKIITTRGTGNGGQHKNTTDSCVIVKHKSTGITARRDGRCQHKNKEGAIDEVTKRVQEYYNSLKKEKVNNNRKRQIGTPSRGERIRTYNFKSGIAKDHRTGKKCNLSIFLRGNIDLLS